MDEFTDFINSMSDYMRDFLKELQEGPSLQDQILAFVHAIDWTEPWIIGLMVFHLLLLTLALLTRRRESIQFGIGLSCLLLVWSAEMINAWCALNWKKFSRQDYFDRNGLFISTLFSGPLIIINVTVLIQLLLTLVRNMVQWKKAELKHRAREAVKADKKSLEEKKKE